LFRTGDFFEDFACRLGPDEGLGIGIVVLQVIHDGILWRFHWGPGRESSVRGVNLMRVRDGRIVEALGYVKGA
jgi:hypothetical protein